MRKILCAFIVCLIASSLLGCSIMQKFGWNQNNNNESCPVSSVVITEDESRKLTDKVPIHLYFTDKESNKLKLEVRYIPVSEAKKSINNLASIIIKELIKGPGQITRLSATMPEGTQLRSPVIIDAGTATVDFTKEFIDKHPGGKIEEQLTIYSVVNSLTELREIQKVKFLIGGKAQKDFKGNFQFDASFPRNTPVISKETALPETGTDNDLKNTCTDELLE